MHHNNFIRNASMRSLMVQKHAMNVHRAVIKTNVDSMVHRAKNVKMDICPTLIKVGAPLKVLIRKFFLFPFDY